MTEERSGASGAKWEIVVRMPQPWRQEVEAIAQARGVPNAVCLRLLLRERLDQIKREARANG